MTGLELVDGAVVAGGSFKDRVNALEDSLKGCVAPDNEGWT